MYITDCIIENCNKKAFFNFETQLKPCYCIDHKESDMVFIKKRMCSKKFCTNKVTIQLNNPKFPLCKNHKQQKETRNKCQYKWGCNNNASYNYIDQIIPIYCRKHKQFKMVSLNTKNRKQKKFHDNISKLVKNINLSENLLTIERTAISQELLQL